MNPNRALAYARSHRPKFVSELKEFLRFPSVSSDPKRVGDVKRCARWLANHLGRLGLRVRVIETSGNPIVYASWRGARNTPTLLLYGHYDVVPAEPLSQWKTHPFRPTLQSGSLYARGATDDKGPLFAHLKAIESYMQTSRALPLNLKCLFEGEEEIGSKHLLPFILCHRDKLRADAAVISDTRMLGPDRPAISYAQRGGLRAEIEVRGPARELHAGTFGGAVLNPLQALCEIVAKLLGPRGRIRIPGFYDDVREWGASERGFMKRAGPSDEKLRREAGAPEGWGEEGYTAYERTTIRPSLDINGIHGGHNGPGVKGVIPTHATAKLSFRLVPDQDPAVIANLFREYVTKIAPAAGQVSVRTFSPIRSVVIDRQHPAITTANRAYEKGFGRPAAFLRSGGSIPVVRAFQDQLGIPTALMGFGLPNDNMHGANEKFDLPIFFRAINTSIWYLMEVARTLGKGTPESHELEWQA